MQLFLVVVVICGNIVYQHAYGALRVVRNSSQTHHEYRDMPACTSPVAIISLHLCQTQSTLVVSVCYHQSKIQSQIERGRRALVDFDGFWVNCRCVSVHPPARLSVCRHQVRLGPDFVVICWADVYAAEIAGFRVALTRITDPVNALCVASSSLPNVWPHKLFSCACECLLLMVKFRQREQMKERIKHATAGKKHKEGVVPAIRVYGCNLRWLHWFCCFIGSSFYYNIYTWPLRCVMGS